MGVKTQVVAIVSAVAVVSGLAGCSGGSETKSSPAANQQAAQEQEKKVEPPLTGEVKANAERAALAAFPGKVVKSEEDAENPGLYAVEIAKADGTSVEVYLSPQFKVVKTKDEGAEDKDG